MKIFPIPAFTDNYIWVLQEQNQAVVVDPGVAEPVEAMLAQQQLSLAAILITHHHWDHINGLEALLKSRPDLPVYGPAKETIAQVNRPLQEGDTVNVPGGSFKILEVPGHTAGHIAYYQENSTSNSLLFCGDTLFASGCGRLFEGTPQQMQASLAKLKQLPANTLIYCTHEYTQANLAFAQAVEPNNEAILARIDEVAALRNNNQPSLPTELSLELQVNPFLRWNEPAVIASANTQTTITSSDPVSIFSAIRAWKDRY